MNIQLIKEAHAQSGIPLKDQFGFGWIGSIGDLLNILIPVGFTLAGLVVTFFFILGALRFIISGGDKQAIDNARNMIIHSIIGLILLLLIFLLLKILPEAIGLKNFKII